MIDTPAPPNVLQLPAGTHLVAGMRHSEVMPTWDMETYSEAGYQWDDERGRWTAPEGAPSTRKRGLPLVGAAVYSEHPTADVLMVAYDLKDGLGERQWFPWLPLPADLCAHITAGRPLEAHNAGFERWMAVNVLTPRYGFPEVKLEQLHCSMAKGRAWSLPPSLDAVGDVLNVGTRKDADGKKLMSIFSMPRNPTKKDDRRRVLPHEQPDDFWRYAAYNMQDIRAEATNSALIPDLTPQEREYYLIDQRINTRGVHVDREGIEACIAILEQAIAKYNAELRTITGGIVTEASKRDAFIAWLASRGVMTYSLDEEAVTALLDRDLDLDVRRALEIRQIIGSASIKKVYSMRLHTARDGRMHDLEIFHGARTGRPTGVGPQPTNLPRSGPAVHYCMQCLSWYPASMPHCPRCGQQPSVQCIECGKWHAPGTFVCCGKPLDAVPQPQEWNPDAVEQALTTIKTRALPAVEMLWGDAVPTMVGCLRGLYNAAPGCDLIGSDYSAIEAVVNAALAGETWRMDVFRSHGRIYEASAAQTFKIPLQEILEYKKRTGHHHPLRQKGKITELALGYLGWIGALRTMGYEGPDEEAKELVLGWRDASPAIVYLGGGQSVPRGPLGSHTAFGGLWSGTEHYYGLEGLAVKAILQPGTTFAVRRLDGTESGLAWRMHGDVLYMLLPDGTYIAYHRPRLRKADDAWRGLAISFEGYNTNPTKGPIGWINMPLYAGIALENACQAVANRILRFGQVNLEAAGYAVVLHVYDENVCEVPSGWGSLEEMEAIMSRMPPWAVDAAGQPWPIKAKGGWRGDRFRK